ncbi:MAG: ParB/RepB/Spo0J family partition protein [Cyanobacteria bacterium J06650_10]
MKAAAKEKPKSTDAKGDAVGIQVALKDIKLPEKQPRRFFDPTRMQQLVESVRKFGILEPLIVRPLLNDRTYELVAGERRLRAAKEVGLKKVPVIVREMTEKEAFELALLENLQRDDLNAIDETEGLLDLLCETLELERQEVVNLLNKAANAERRGQSLTDNVIRQIEKIDEVFVTVGRLNRESFRSNRLPLLNLSEDVLEVLRNGKLEYTKAKAIDKLTNAKQRKDVMEQVIRERLSLVDVKKLVRRLLGKQGDAVKSSDMRAELKSLVQTKSTAWEDQEKQQKLKKLLSELRAILRE